MPQGEPAPSSPKSKRTLTSSEQMESGWGEDLNIVSDYPARPQNDRRKPCSIKRQNFVIRRPPQGWPKDNSNVTPHTPVHSPEYIPMIPLPPPTKPSDLRKVIWERSNIRPQGELPHRPDSLYVDPINWYIYNELDEEEEKKVTREEMEGLYKPVEDKETLL